MAAPPRAQDVLDFLASNGFSGAASALRSDILSRDGDDDDDGSPPRPPPVRTAPPPPRACSVASSSSDAFVSIGSSPSGLVNPYGLSSPSLSRAESDDSSDREFGTAREYYGEFNLFGETRWCDDDLGNPYASSNGGAGADDKFVTATEERFGEHGGCAGDGKGVSGESGGCFFALCDCRGGEAAERAGKSKLDSAAVYGRYWIMPDETERLDECGEDAYQLKRIDDCARAVPAGGDAFLDMNQMGQKRNNLGEAEFQMLCSYTFTESNLANEHPTCEPKIIDTSSFRTNTNQDKLQAKSSKCDLINKKYPQRDANNDPEIEENAKHDGKNQDAWALELEGEDHGTANELLLSSIPEDEYEIFHLRIIHRKNRTGFEENKDLPIILNTIIAGRYLVTEYLGSAAFSKVVQAHDLHTGVDVCLKIIKNDKDFFDQSLDEIKLLKYVNKYDPADEHHLLRLYDYFYYQEHLFIVCELLRANLYEFQKYNQDAGGEGYFTLPRIQAIARQCLEALEYLHDLRIIHCDLKPENILIKSYSRCEIKIIDLGSSCFQTDSLCLYVQSRSYRAPEVILGLPYSQKIDIWSLGCVLAELYIGDVLFPNESLVMMLARMVGILGPIDIEMLEMGQETHKYFTDDYDLYHKNEETDELEYLIPEKSSLAHQLQVSDTAFIDFLSCLLQINPKRRPTANQALQHRWFSSYQ